MSDDCSKPAKRVAFCMTGLNLICGLLNLIMGIYTIDPFQIAGGAISLSAGTILLIGIIKDNAKFLLVYLISETVMFALGTVCGLLLVIVLVTVSAQITDGPKDVKIGKTIVVDKYVAGLIAFFVLVVIIVAWIVHFLMYVFYDDVAERNREAARRGSAAVRYNAITETTEGDGNVYFINKNSSPLV